MFWSEGIVSMDLIADYGKAVAGKSAIKLELNLTNVPDTLTGELKFAYSDADSKNQVVKVASTNEIKTADGKLVGFDVTLEGLNPGASEVTATFGDYTARLMVTVTAELKVVLEHTSVEHTWVELTLKALSTTPPTYGPSEPVPVTLKLFDKRGNEIKADEPTLTWEVVSANTDVATYAVDSKKKDTITVTGVTAGETQISITATYTLNGTEYTAVTLLRVTVTQPETGGETG